MSDASEKADHALQRLGSIGSLSGAGGVLALILLGKGALDESMRTQERVLEAQERIEQRLQDLSNSLRAHSGRMDELEERQGRLESEASRERTRIDRELGELRACIQHPRRCR